MYEPRFDALARRFKGRRASAPVGPVRHALIAAYLGWTTFTPVGVFCTPPRVVPRVFTYFKKALRYPKATSRFWVSAQCAHLVTRKPLNVRMGKGKGARVRRYTKGRGTAPLAAVSVMRAGVRTRVRRFIATRLGCPVLVTEPDPAKSAPPPWARQWRTQASLIRDRARELRGLLKLIRRPATRLFFARLFSVAWRRPRLKWRWRWPLLPKRAGAGRGRAVRPGSGFRPLALLWAGAASLAAGVRRRRREKLCRPPRAQAAWAWAGRGRGWAAALASVLASAGAGAARRGPAAAALASFAQASRAPGRPPVGGGGAGLGPSPRALRALERGWDALGVALPRLARSLGGGWGFAPLRGGGVGGGVQSLSVGLVGAASSPVRGRWRVNPSLLEAAAELTTAGAVVARAVARVGGGLPLTRCAAAPLLMAAFSLWPASGVRSHG